jgi:arginase
MKRSLLRSFDKVSILSVPMNLGQPNKGLDVAPARLISSGLVDLLTKIGWKSEIIPALTTTVQSTGDFVDVVHGKTKNCAQVGAVCEQISKYVAKECSSTTFPLILGGDHCISIGTIHGIAKQRPNTGVVWVSRRFRVF